MPLVVVVDVAGFLDRRNVALRRGTRRALQQSGKLFAGFQAGQPKVRCARSLRGAESAKAHQQRKEKNKPPGHHDLVRALRDLGPASHVTRQRGSGIRRLIDLPGVDERRLASDVGGTARPSGFAVLRLIPRTSPGQWPPAVEGALDAKRHPGQVSALSLGPLPALANAAGLLDVANIFAAQTVMLHRVLACGLQAVLLDGTTDLLALTGRWSDLRVALGR